MRISDWSSDVCSSDLQRLPAAQVVPHPLQGQGALAADVQAGHALLQELQRTVDPELIVREGIDAMGQAHEPPAVGIVGGELGRHPELAQGGKVERRPAGKSRLRSEEHTSELQSLMRISYAVFCLKKKIKKNKQKQQ